MASQKHLNNANWSSISFILSGNKVKIKTSACVYIIDNEWLNIQTFPPKYKLKF
jgi:hypothetical protein